MKKIIIILLSSLFFQGCAFSRHKIPVQETELKYNVHEDKWSRERMDAELKYNVYEKRWIYAHPNSKLRFNIYEKKWEFTD